MARTKQVQERTRHLVGVEAVVEAMTEGRLEEEVEE